jgi:hypothetical protein
MAWRTQTFEALTGLFEGVVHEGSREFSATLKLRRGGVLYLEYSGQNGRTVLEADVHQELGPFSLKPEYSQARRASAPGDCDNCGVVDDDGGKHAVFVLPRPGGHRHVYLCAACLQTGMLALGS